MKRISVGILVLVAWTATTLSSQALSINTLYSEFNAGGLNSDPNTPPYVGEGILSYAGPALADGTYAWTDLNPTLTITFTGGGPTFTQDGLLTTAADVDVEIRGDYFFFTNVNYFGNGPQSGSADFYDTTDFYVLTTEPGNPGDTDFIQSGSADSPLYVLEIADGYTSIGSGHYGVPVSEPSQWATLIGLGFLALVGIRRLRGACI